MQVLNKLILIISLTAYSLNISAAKLDKPAQEAAVPKQEDKSRIHKLKQWIQEHKLISTIAAAVIIAGIGTGGYFLLSKSNKEKNIAIMLDTKKDDQTRLEIARNLYQERISNLQKYLNEFDASSPDDPRRSEIIQKAYPFLPEDVKFDIKTSAKKRNPTIEFKEDEDVAKVLTNERIVELTKRYKDKAQERLGYINDSLRVITSPEEFEKLKKLRPGLVDQHYSTPEKINQTIKQDLEWAQDYFVKPKE